MRSEVVFVDNLPPALRELIEPYCTPIAGYWGREAVLDNLFKFCEEDYYTWIKTPQDEVAEKAESTLLTFVDACLDWINTIDEAEGIDVEDMFCDVALTHFPAFFASSKEGWLRSDAIWWVRSLVQNAIANNQPLPQE